MDPDLGYWIRVWEDTLFWAQSGGLLGKVDLLIFSAKVTPSVEGGSAYF